MKKFISCPALELFSCLPQLFSCYSYGKQWDYLEKNYKMQQTIDHHVEEESIDLSCILLAVCLIKRKVLFHHISVNFDSIQLILIEKELNSITYLHLKLEKERSRWNILYFAWMSAYLHVHFVEKVNAKAPAVPSKAVGARWVGWANFPTLPTQNCQGQKYRKSQNSL